MYSIGYIGINFHAVISDLIGNAVKFTSQGKIEVNCKSKGNVDGKWINLLFSVADTGIGIPLNKQKIVFNNFAQADSSTTRQYGGSGLGLAISKRLVELMGGTIWVETNEHKGSTFFFTVRLGIAEEKQGSDDINQTETQENKIATIIEKIKSMTAKDSLLRILIVEDIATNRMINERFLQVIPVDTHIAENGKIAVDLFKSNTYDFILMDMQMPVMSGFEATEMIRQIEKEQGLKKMPIIALTAAATPDEIQASLDSGCDQVLTKPISQAKLIETLYNFL